MTRNYEGSEKKIRERVNERQSKFIQKTCSIS
jgi:hypothetical protein